MNVAIIGGTGFVGSYITDTLIDAGLRPVLLVRPGSEAKVSRSEQCTIVSGDVDDLDALTATVNGADAVIYNIGILREVPRSGITFERLQEQAAKRVIDLAQQHRVERFLLMSANGVDAAVTRYQQTKLAAENHLQNSSLDWTVFRPSVVFGDPRGRMEFATQLKRDIVDAPVPAPMFFPGFNPTKAGMFKMSPVHVQNVADAFVNALQQAQTVGEILHLGGPESLSWREIIKTLASVAGRRKAMVPVPALGVSGAAALLDRWERFPITKDQIDMLLQGNVCAPADLVRLGITPIPFDVDQLSYLTHTSQEPSPWQQNAA